MSIPNIASIRPRFTVPSVLSIKYLKANPSKICLWKITTSLNKCTPRIKASTSKTEETTKTFPTKPLKPSFPANKSIKFGKSITMSWTKSPTVLTNKKSSSKSTPSSTALRKKIKKRPPPISLMTRGTASKKAIILNQKINLRVQKSAIKLRAISKKHQKMNQVWKKETKGLHQFINSVETHNFTISCHSSKSLPQDKFSSLFSKNKTKITIMEKKILQKTNQKSAVI